VREALLVSGSLPTALGVALFALGCSTGPESGPVEIAWDRDNCEHCYMTIGDRRVAAQVRVEEGGSAHAFDELGCALLWMNSQGGAERRDFAELWVRDPVADRWIDGERTRYTRIAGTPMDYGFVAVVGEGLSLDDVWTAVVEMEDERRHPRR
jgi:hypothetical protein